jgi:hypothetical protein
MSKIEKDKSRNNAAVEFGKFLAEFSLDTASLPASVKPFATPYLAQSNLPSTAAGQVNTNESAAPPRPEQALST